MGSSQHLDPKEQLLRKMLAYSEIKKRFHNKTPVEIAVELGFKADDEVVGVLEDLLKNQLYK